MHVVLSTHAKGICKDNKKEAGFGETNKLVLRVGFIASVLGYKGDRDVVWYAGK